MLSKTFGFSKSRTWKCWKYFKEEETILFLKVQNGARSYFGSKTVLHTLVILIGNKKNIHIFSMVIKKSELVPCNKLSLHRTLFFSLLPVDFYGQNLFEEL